MASVLMSDGGGGVCGGGDGGDGDGGGDGGSDGDGSGGDDGDSGGDGDGDDCCHLPPVCPPSSPWTPLVPLGLHLLALPTTFLLLFLLCLFLLGINILPHHLYPSLFPSFYPPSSSFSSSSTSFCSSLYVPILCGFSSSKAFPFLSAFPKFFLSFLLCAFFCMMSFPVMFLS